MTDTSPGDQTSGGSPGADRIRTGIDTARHAVGLMSTILDEVTAGFDEVARRGVRVVNTSLKEVRLPATPGGSSTPGLLKSRDGSGGTGKRGDVDDELAGQVVQLAREVIRLATDTATRLLDVAVGPVERLIDPQAAQDRDTWLTLDSVKRGEHGTGTFVVVDDGGTGPEIVVELRNELASMSDTIPIDAVTFRQLVEGSPPGDLQKDGTVRIPAGGQATVEVHVAVPDATAPGTYLGIVRSPQIDGLHLVLEVPVT